VGAFLEVLSNSPEAFRSVTPELEVLFAINLDRNRVFFYHASGGSRADAYQRDASWDLHASSHIHSVLLSR
jgi:hypothetical protein